MSTQPQIFEDDSSRALGLNHHMSGRGQSGIDASFAEEESRIHAEIAKYASMVDKDGRRIYQDISQIPLRNEGAHDALAALLDDGVDLWDALDYLGAEMATESAIDADERPDVAGPWSPRKVEGLMRASVAPDKRGSRSRTKRHGGSDPVDPTTVATALERQLASMRGAA